MNDLGSDDVSFRVPTPDDAAALHALCQRVGLDLNSAYAYLLVSSHWADTSVVAELDGKIAGFVSGYRPPSHDDAYFVWQVGSAPEARGRGLARRMILEVLGRDACRGVRYIEATVTPDNEASQRLFASVARELDTAIEVSPHFRADQFPGDHAAEELHRIGPIARRQVDPVRDEATRVFREHESAVRSYCRSFPAVFDRAEGHELIDEHGKRYIDFFAGAGVMSYGHNPPELREALAAYIERGGLTHGLDLYTVAKRDFMQSFVDRILEPRDMDYRVMFPGPTGTNAVESAIKLARLYTGRETIVAFTEGYHGMTLGALAATGNESKREGAGIPLPFTQHMPFDGYFGDADTIAYFEKYLADTSSGVDVPAAAIVETVQGEGGVNVSSHEWLKRLSDLCRRFGILLIVDDIQVGCGRTGPFFSFEPSGVKPDIITLSKAMSGYGLPFALTLMRPDLDIWTPAKHNGTFRGHQLAMVTAAVALQKFWSDDALARDVQAKGEHALKRLQEMGSRHDFVRDVRGRGLILGMELEGDLADRLSAACFQHGLIVETCGPRSEVLKLLPPLTIERAALDAGLDVIETALEGLAGAGG
ncbi:MAG: diaminobutyrate--2-oxoglutarate transaminase [Myxococcales bacterium]|jgi:diaminobutyrate-2-oxoglutarate transaminase